MSENSTSTVMHAMYSAETSPNPPVLFYIGDFCCKPSLAVQLVVPLLLCQQVSG